MPRFHVGESLMPETYWIFERLGILHDLDRARFHSQDTGSNSSTATTKKPSRLFFPNTMIALASSKLACRNGREFDQLLYDTAFNRGSNLFSDETRVLDIDIRKKSPHRVTLANIQLVKSTTCHGER